jgi:1-acyl-sn-glycerol-3-phosphate acyltransferase
MSLTSESRRLKRWRIGHGAYNHAQWEKRRRFLRFLLTTIGMTFLIKLDRVEGLENIPDQGAAVLLMNHIAFVDPIVLIQTVPRYITPMAKIEVYQYPVVGIFPRIWGVIPVRREEFDRRAVQGALEVLKAGEILLVAPEGTRSPQLQRGKEGFAYLASRAGAPVIPVALEGTEGFPALRYAKRWRQPGASVRFGKPFRFRPEYRRASGEELRRMADEAMYLLAGLLPASRRGTYADMNNATQDTIVWLEP